MSVLLVDDEQMILDLTRMVLSHSGYKVTTAIDYDQAYKRINEIQYDIIIVDSGIDKNGFADLVYFVNTIENGPLIFAMIGKGQDEDLQKYKLMGVYDFINKPFSNSTLVNKVENGLEHKGLRDRIYSLQRQIELNDNNSIVRSIEFSPENYQAGLSILTYFNTVVNQKYPDKKVKIKIEQENNVVRMVIETSEGDKEEVERTLEQYGLVVRGEILPETLLEGTYEIMSLRHKLELAAIELRQNQEIYRISESKNNERISNLEGQVSYLRAIVSDGLMKNSNAFDMLYRMLDMHMQDKQIKGQLEIIIDKLNSGVKQSDEEEVKRILVQLENSSPGILVEIKNFVIATMAGTSGNLLSSWISTIISCWRK